MSYKPTENLDPAVQHELQKVGIELSKPLRLAVRYKAPEKPGDGEICICDGVHWDPLIDGIKRPVWFDNTVQLWKKFQ